VDEKPDADKSEWETCDDDDDWLKFRCSSALDGRSPPMSDAAELSTCEPIQRRPPQDQVSPHGAIFDEPLPVTTEGVRDFTSPADVESQAGHETETDFHAICDDEISQSGQGVGGPESVLKAVEVYPHSSGDHGADQVSCAVGFPDLEPEADCRGNFGKRVTSHRRCSRRREKGYGVKRRRRSPHPSNVYRMSIPRQPKPALWQPWHDDHDPPASVQHGSSLQVALENLRCLSCVSSTSGSHGASASAVTTPATGNVTSPVNQMTSSVPAMGNKNFFVAI